MSRVSRRCWRQDLSAFWSSLSWRSRSVSEAWNGCKSSTWDVRWQQSSLGRRDSEGGRCGGVTRSGLPPHASATAKRDSPDTLRSRLMILELTFEHSINKGLRPARPQRTKREDAPVSAVPSSAAFGDCVLEGVLFEWYQLTFLGPSVLLATLTLWSPTLIAKDSLTACEIAARSSSSLSTRPNATCTAPTSSVLGHPSSWIESVDSCRRLLRGWGSESERGESCAGWKGEVGEENESTRAVREMIWGNLEEC